MYHYLLLGLITAVILLTAGCFFFFPKKIKKIVQNDSAVTIDRALLKTRNLWQGVFSLFSKSNLNEDDYQKIEEILISSDVSVQTAGKILKSLESTSKKAQDFTLKTALKHEILEIFKKAQHGIPEFQKDQTSVLLVAGVNGSGKTSSIAKLGNQFIKQKKSVMFVAADTFRSAAIEQLEIWSKRLNIPFYSQKHGSDPAAVIFDGVQKAHHEKKNIVLCDTAGRLSSKEGLMQELSKVYSVTKKIVKEDNVYPILVLDATIGQNSLKQVESFSKALPIKGIIMTKLDGTAKGGALISIMDHYPVSIWALGLGERSDDLLNFSASSYVESLLP